MLDALPQGCLLAQEALDAPCPFSSQCLTDWRVHMLVVSDGSKLHGFVHRPSSYMDLTKPKWRMTNLRDQFLSCQMDQMARGDPLGLNDTYKCVIEVPSSMQHIASQLEQILAELLAADNVLLPVGRSRFQMMGCDFHLDSRYEAKLIECNPSAGHNWARRLHREDWLETIAMDALKMTKSLKPQPGWTALPSPRK